VNQPLDILIVESHPGAGAEATDALTAVGHRVHRCFSPDAETFPCVGIAGEHACPADGPLDVALVVRRGVTPEPTAIEQGVTCAIRAGVPIVEHGSDAADPFASWVTARVADDVVEACEKVGISQILIEVAEDAIGLLLDDAGIARTAVHCRFGRDGERLVLHLISDVRLDQHQQNVLGVRALEAVKRGAQVPYRELDVQFHQPGTV